MTLRVGWLADEHDPPGGAELTQSEFRDAAPEGVEVVQVDPGDLGRIVDCDVAAVHNCVTYPDETIDALKGLPVFKYANDVMPHGNIRLRRWLFENATFIFTSPLHQERFPHRVAKASHLVPPPVDLARFRDAQNGRCREGTLWVGNFTNHAKGIPSAAKWAETGGQVDFYGHGPLAPSGENVKVLGAVGYDDMPAVMARYERFLFLPIRTEPFGRVVVEAWAAGCRLVTNRLVGALHWIENDPEAIDRATQDFWELIAR